MKFAHTFDVGSGLKTNFRKFISSSIKNLARENPQIVEDAVNRKRVTSTRLNISTNKITDVSSTINALQNGTKLAAITPRGFDAT